jgi:hypothetical protein
MIETFMSWMGVLGAVLCILAYFLLERGKLSAEGMSYYIMNGAGAFLVLVGAFYSYDSGDLGAIVQEFCWVAISMVGIVKILNKKGERK